MRFFINNYDLSGMGFWLGVDEQHDGKLDEYNQRVYKTGTAFRVHCICFNQIVLRPVSKEYGDHKFCVDVNVLEFAFTESDIV